MKIRGEVVRVVQLAASAIADVRGVVGAVDREGGRVHDALYLLLPPRSSLEHVHPTQRVDARDAFRIGLERKIRELRQVDDVSDARSARSLHG